MGRPTFDDIPGMEDSSGDALDDDLFQEYEEEEDEEYEDDFSQEDDLYEEDDLF